MDSFYRVDDLQSQAWHIEPMVQTTSPEMHHVRRAIPVGNAASSSCGTRALPRAPALAPKSRLSTSVLTAPGDATQNPR